jgi:hypothetical protein
MDQQSQEEIINELRKTNNRLRGVQNMLIGVLITTGLMALFFIILYSKIAKLINMSMEDI